ncbi:MAG: hypothetical protein GY798_05450 [Hyphomicrobiales bacterium]|nr:hypothetical protein [Hyphomicrobiales bacterium]
MFAERGAGWQSVGSLCVRAGDRFDRRFLRSISIDRRFWALPFVEKLSADFECTGFLGFDYRRTANGFVMIKCDPRLDAGVFITPAEWVCEAVPGEPSRVRLVEAGARRQYDARLLSPAG